MITDKFKENVRKTLNYVQKEAVKKEAVDDLREVVPEDKAMEQLSMAMNTLALITDILSDNVNIVCKYAFIKTIMEEIKQEPFSNTLEDDLNCNFKKSVIEVDFTNGKFKN